MPKEYILYNPSANEADTKKAINGLKEASPCAEILNICEIKDLHAFFDGLEPDASVTICGGDGTLNHFINDIDKTELCNDIYYIPTGTGNDFARDIGQEPFKKSDKNINRYLKDLPRVTVNGMTRLFLNNVGFGIDGYCCECGDAMRIENKKREKPKVINYTKIAIFGLLFHFKPRNAQVIVDGKQYSYKKVWLATAMNGRFYGGGMMPTPQQDRLREDGKISVLVFHNVGKLKALMIFPSIFSGKHLKHTKQIAILEGASVQVRFDEPTPLQIDGETISGVTEYSIEA